MQNKTRRCSSCRKKVDSQDALYGSLKAFCSYQCLRSYMDSESGQKAVQRSQHVSEVKEKKERKEKLKTRSDRVKEAQVAFNRYVRLRDQNKPCISCGSFSEQKVGGTRDCGHYLSRGARPQHRFNLMNTASQCVKCNRYLSGVPADFRLGLVSRWGENRIVAMENDNAVRRYSEEYLIRLKSVFNRRANLYQRKFR